MSLDPNQTWTFSGRIPRIVDPAEPTLEEHIPHRNTATRPIVELTGATEQVTWRHHGVAAVREAAAARVIRRPTVVTPPPVRRPSTPSLLPILLGAALFAIVGTYTAAVIVAGTLGALPPLAAALLVLGGLLLAFAGVCLVALVQTLRSPGASLRRAG